MFRAVVLTALVSLASWWPLPVSAAEAGTWGPLVSGDCVADGLRRYSAALHEASLEGCAGPFLNVMGAHFERPTSCDGGVGHFDVRDSRCDAQMPSLPPRGADDAPPREAEGYADLHNHLFAHLAFGGSVIVGELWGEPEEALAPVKPERARAHSRIEGFASSRDLWAVFASHDEMGHPDYTGWPTPHLKTHQQTYVDWLRRAYEGGLRLVVAPAVNNQDMGGRGENRIGFLNGLMGAVGARATPLPDRTTNDMEALEIQTRAAHEFEAWVAEHQGGWLAVAETPEEASELIASGRLAIVLGSEVDHVLNCDFGRRCDEAWIREGLDKLEALGLAVIFPTHHKATQLGDSANFQPLNTGPLRDCPQFTMPCAATGMTDLGRFMIREMMRRGLLVDLGHAGDRPFEDTMQLLEAESYPTFMTHASAHPLKPAGSAEYTLTYEQLRRIDAVGGMVSFHDASGEYAGADNGGATIPFGCEAGGGAYVQSYLYTRDAMGGGIEGVGGQIALAPDWNGFADWPAGRFVSEGCPVRTHEASGQPLPLAPRLTYPIRLPRNLKAAAVGGARELPRMVFAGKRFDFNETGLAHAGLQPDLLEDMRLHGLSEADLDPFYRSARGFIEMWRRAREARVEGDRGWLRWIPQSPTDLIDYPYLDESRLVEVSPGVRVCRWRGTGQVGALRDGRCEVVEGEQPAPPSEITVASIRNANSGMCLRHDARQAVCDGGQAESWSLKRVRERPDLWQLVASGDGGCLTVSRGGRVRLRPCESAPDQRWELERVGNTFRLRPESERGCLAIANRSLSASTRAELSICPAPGRADFHWEIDGYRDVVDYELLFATRDRAASVGWKRAADEAHQHAVLGVGGAELCRVEGGIGTVGADGLCRAPGHDPAPDYDRLVSSTPVD